MYSLDAAEGFGEDVGSDKGVHIVGSSRSWKEGGFDEGVLNGGCWSCFGRGMNLARVYSLEAAEGFGEGVGSDESVHIGGSCRSWKEDGSD